MGRCSADPGAYQRLHENRDGCVLWAMTWRRAALAAGPRQPLPRDGEGALRCKAGDDRYADGEGRDVRSDMHRVAMTRKPFQCLASRLGRNRGWQCVTPKDPVSRTLGDAVAANYLAGWSAPTPRPDGSPSSSDPTGAVGCGLVYRVVCLPQRHLPLEQGCTTWGMHGSAICVWIGISEPGTTTGKPPGLELMSSSSRFGLNFSCLAEGRNESIKRKPIRMQLA